jgi:antitoxin VapB
MQRAQDRVARHRRGADVDHRRQRAHALAVAVAVHRDEAALGLRDRVESVAALVDRLAALPRPASVEVRDEEPLDERPGL